MPSVYYTFGANPCTGGDYVNLDHVRALRRLGVDAKIYFLRSREEATGFGDLPLICNVGEELRIVPEDVFILAETLPGMIAQFANPEETISHCRVILHQQSPFIGLCSFESALDINRHPFEQIIVPSENLIRRLQEVEVNKSISVIHPYVPDFFSPKEKMKEPVRIVYSSRKRSEEVNIIMYYFRSLYRGKMDIQFVDLIGIDRQQVAELMAHSAIYLSFAEREALGLMALEAMASGCHIVGFSGYAGSYSEYFNDTNGDWIAEGDYLDFTHKIIAAIELFVNGEPNPKVEAGLDTVEKRFRYHHFEQDVKTVFEQILDTTL